jgi:phospho-2-dehydro-3-deoxyheptonate aldolase
MIYAPERPTTSELHDVYDIDYQTAVDIAETRININAAIVRPNNRFLLVGPCALTDDADALLLENQEWLAFAKENGLVAAVRRHPWKPRSVKTWGEKMMKWHGLETGYVDASGDPGEATLTAYDIMHNEAMTHKNVSMEIAFDEHVYRYGPMLSFAQIGARTREEYYGSYDEYLAFLDFLAKREAVLPIGIKNDTSGSIICAHEEVQRVNEIRSNLGMSATSRAVLIYRGGENAKTPETWEAGAIAAIQLTNGAVILDVAHGGEQAFDPNGAYEKSEDGQLACLEVAMRLKDQGLTYVGVASETSSLQGPMDPAASPEAVRMLLKGANVLIPA